ncbi:hypothetical protein RF11_00817 [Thelohanellus kitauei]|uniref:Uncharacterized protein n=1 Tax=Thelohanellus kitauei TaxID=669202 RepID=A0A0C2N4I5_THEKT|nr:hypothetical protein RF11_00817 [Thelohanellus kitauei]
MDVKRIPTLFSNEMQVPLKVSDFKIDKFKKCMYSLTEYGILQKCYGTRTALEHRQILINQDVRIVGIDFDTSNHYLYYHTKHSIVVMDMKMMIQSTIYTTSDLIYFLKLDLTEL